MRVGNPGKTGDIGTNRHLILMTDGHTYGIEEECYRLAQRAGEEKGSLLTRWDSAVSGMMPSWIV
jgi:hypothetical protein